MNIVIYTDGGCKNNQVAEKRVAYASFAIYNDSHDLMPGERLHVETKSLGNMTNNEAEYWATIIGLTEALSQTNQVQAEKIILRTDSRLVVNQLGGEFKIKRETLKPLYKFCVYLIEQLEKRSKSGSGVEIRWTPREEIVKILGH